MGKTRNAVSLGVRPSILPSLLAHSQSQHLSRLLSLRISLQRVLHLAHAVPPLGLGAGEDASEAKAVREKLAQLRDIAEQLRDAEMRGVASSLRKRRKPEEEDEEEDDNKKSKKKGKKAKKAKDDGDNEKDDLDNDDFSFESMKSSVWSPTLDAARRAIDLASGFSGAAGQVGGGSLSSLGNNSSVLQASFWTLVEGTRAHEQLSLGKSAAADEAASLADLQAGLPPSLSSLPSAALSALRAGLSFDDSKLYREQLKDFVADGARGVGDGAPGAERFGKDGERVGGGGKKSEKGKAANGVDRRASKGRKIKEVVHPKIVNYCFPVRRKVQTGGGMVSDDEWFKSLFGGVLRGGRN